MPEATPAVCPHLPAPHGQHRWHPAPTDDDPAPDPRDCPGRAAHESPDANVPPADGLLFRLRDAIGSWRTATTSLAQQYAAVDAMTASAEALDQHLTDGGQLPVDWRPAEPLPLDPISAGMRAFAEAGISAADIRPLRLPGSPAAMGEWWPDTAKDASPLSHVHRHGGQSLLHAHPGGDLRHGYYGHPEDAPVRDPQPGDRNGQRVVLTSGPNRLEGVVTSDSVSWLTLLTDTGAKLSVDLDLWDVETHGEPGEPAAPRDPVSDGWTVDRGGYVPEGGIGGECSPACSEGHTYAGACILAPADPPGLKGDGAALGPVNGELVVAGDRTPPWRRITVRADEYGAVTLDVER